MSSNKGAEGSAEVVSNFGWYTDASQASGRCHHPLKALFWNLAGFSSVSLNATHLITVLICAVNMFPETFLEINISDGFAVANYVGFIYLLSCVSCLCAHFYFAVLFSSRFQTLFPVCLTGSRYSCFLPGNRWNAAFKRLFRHRLAVFLGIVGVLSELKEWVSVSLNLLLVMTSLPQTCLTG